MNTLTLTQLQQEKFSLVLSGGGALGIAHLGVLHDLEKNDLKPSELVGTSMGGIICACVAIGMKEREIYEKLIAFSKVYKWIKFSFWGNAIVKNAKIAKIFSQFFKEKKMSDTLIPLKIITTNLKNGEKKVFTSEDKDIYIKDAILATMAIPGIFEEHTIDGEIYGDGFLCENLGLPEASYDNIVAVDVLGKNSFLKTLPNHFFKTSNILEMFEKSIRLFIYNQTQTNLKYSKKNIYLLEPFTCDFKTFQFYKHKEIRSLGLGLL